MAAAVLTPIEEIVDERLERRGVTVYMKRDDLIHPSVPGNKWRKLKYNLEAARNEGRKTLLTFGGAFSNHVYAVANAGHIYGFQTIGIIRGEEHLPLNPVLAHAVECGMQLRYESRERYREKGSDAYITELRSLVGDDFYLLPEGGTNELAVKGAAEVVDEIDVPADVVCCACGTGGTLAGLVVGLARRGQGAALGVAALKGAGFLRPEIQGLVGEASAPWDLSLDFHCGGFAKVTPELLGFIADFEERHEIVLDPIYTGKMMLGLFKMAEQGRWSEGMSIVAIHTGGAPRSHWSGLS